MKEARSHLTTGDTCQSASWFLTALEEAGSCLLPAWRVLAVIEVANEREVKAQMYF